MDDMLSVRGWDADPEASFARRLGKSVKEFHWLGDEPSKSNPGCPEIWELSNGDVAVIGRDLTEPYVDRLPEGVTVAEGERIVVIPQVIMIAAKKDISDA